MKIKGFSLIELLITIAIISIIATFSIATYCVPIVKTKQNSAKLDLINLTSFIEQYYDYHQSYEGMTLIGLGYKPMSTEYEIMIISANERDYKIAAVPKKPSKQDACGKFFLDQDGNKTISGNANLEDCW